MLVVGYRAVVISDKISDDKHVRVQRLRGIAHLPIDNILKYTAFGQLLDDARFHHHHWARHLRRLMVDMTLSRNKYALCCTNQRCDGKSVRQGIWRGVVVDVF
jgi:hypothetical protein